MTTSRPTPRRAGAIAVGSALAVGAALAGASPAAADPNSTRYSGDDRYATTAASFRAATNNDTTPNAVLAGGGAFPDALSANYLAGRLQTGTLLTRPNSLSPVALEAIQDANVTTVYVVGGAAAVSDSTIATLRAAKTDNGSSITVERVGGANRYETNAAVNERASEVGSGLPEDAAVNRTLVASGEGFADALALGPVAYAARIPLVLTPGARLGTEARAQLEQLKNPVDLAGSSDVVSATTVNQIRTASGQSVNRLGGADRSETAVQVATFITGNAAYNEIFTRKFEVGITNGLNFPDAVGAGPVVGQEGAALLLTRNATNLGGAATYGTTLKNRDALVFAFGGADVLPNSTVSALLEAMTPTAASN